MSFGLTRTKPAAEVARLESENRNLLTRLDRSKRTLRELAPSRASIAWDSACMGGGAAAGGLARKAAKGKKLLGMRADGVLGIAGLAAGIFSNNQSVALAGAGALAPLISDMIAGSETIASELGTDFLDEYLSDNKADNKEEEK